MEMVNWLHYLHMSIEATRENVTNDFRMSFCYVFVHAKNDSVNGMPENVASMRIFTKMTASVFHIIQSNIKFLCRFKSPIYGYLPHEEAD